MESTTSPPPATTGDRLPWPGLLVLGGVTFVMVTAEMLPTAVLRPLSAGLSTSEPRAAQLVSLWATVVVVASFPLVALTRRFDRRTVIVVATTVLALSDVLTAVAPSYPAAAAGRLLGAAAVGLLWASVNAHVADLVPDRLLGPAVSVVLGCATSGMVLGTPIARLLADLTSWRVSFLALGLLSVLVAALVRVVVPAAGRPDPDVGPRPVPDDRHSVTPVVVIAGLVGLALVGHYGAYTYITVLTQGPARALPGGTATLLLAFGAASAAGLALSGRVRNRTLPGLAAAVVATGLSLAALHAVGPHPLAGLAALVAWGVASGAMPALAQTEIMRRAGVRHRALAGALIPVLFNGGIAIGAALASLLAGADGADALPLPAAAVVLAAGLALSRDARAVRPRPPATAAGR